MSSPIQGGDPVQGGRPLLRGRVLGFPVHLDLSFMVIMGILGYYYFSPYVTPLRLTLWLLIAPLSVLCHELGHAVLAQAAGARPQIALAGFGGVTTFIPPTPLSRLRSLGISLAGPAVGLVLGFALLGLRRGLGDSLTGWQYDAVDIGVWTCLGWSALNLLPILPLDGGQAMRELLPGSPAVRTRRAAMVSIAVAILTAVIVYQAYRQPFIALFLALYAFNNVLLLRQTAPAAVGTRPSSATPEQAVVELLWQSQPARARELLESFPAGTPIDLAVNAAVLTLTGDPAQGHALLDQEVQRRPGDRNVAALLLLTQALEHDWDAVIGTVQGPIGPNVPPSAIDRAIAEAHGTGREDVAGRLRLITHRPAN